MTLAAIRHLTPSESNLASWDTRWKLAGVLLAAVAISLTRTWQGSSSALFATLMFAMLGRVPRRWLRPRLFAIFLGVVPFLLILPWTVDDGWSIALSLSARALALAILALTLVATTPVPEAAAAAHALRLPGVLVQLALLTYRYIFVLADELRRLDVALRARAFRNRFNAHSFRTVGRVMGALLVRGRDRGERVSEAMRARGFDGRFRAITHFHTRWRDVLLFTMLITSASAILAADFWFR